MMVRHSVIPLACLIASTFALSTSTSGHADTLEISGGGHLSGSATRQVEKDKVDYVLVKVDQDITVAIQKQRVRHLRSSNELAEYRVKLSQLPDDAGAHYQFARWCSGKSLKEQWRYHMQRAIALDPNHESARAALNYVKDGSGNWILYAQQQRNLGKIQVAGRWQFAETVAKERMQEEYKIASSKWIKEVKKLRARYMNRSNPKSSREAFDELRGIRDPTASAAIADELSGARARQSNQPRELRLLWVELLSQFRDANAHKALLSAGLDDSDAVVREAALEKMQGSGRGSAIASLVPMLNPKKNSIRNVRRALRALTYFPDRELAMTYIDALETTHSEKVPPGAGTNAGFTGDGSGSFSTGNKEVVITKSYRNDDAHTLLVLIEPNADYGFNKQAWRDHFAKQLTVYEGNLRRDP